MIFFILTRNHYLVLRNVHPFQRMKILVVGDSEAAAFKGAAHILNVEFGLEVICCAEGGRSIVDSLIAVKSAYTPDIPVVLLLGLTCFSWTLQPLFRSTSIVNLVAVRSEADYTVIPAFMNEVIQHCTSLNENCRVYLVIPSIKDMYRYNLRRLERNDLREYIPVLDKDGRFNKGMLNEAVRWVYKQQCELKKDGYCWREKRFLMMNHALNFHTESVLGWSTSRGPHVKFLKSLTGSLQYEAMIHDGLHYTPECIRCFFWAYAPMCYWINPVIPPARPLGNPSLELVEPSPVPVVVEESPEGNINDVVADGTEEGLDSPGDSTDQPQQGGNTESQNVGNPEENLSSVNTLTSTQREITWNYLQGLERMVLGGEVSDTQRSELWELAEKYVKLLSERRERESEGD
ncbi:hypothetical protein Avbf_18381 [Armadillidium vulgare]|nr:hypothetical protein Avbf_18381 [Armadillidium vulgare]